jgi:hypothetical protein
MSASPGIAKGASPALPYVVANELICGNLARLLLLPVPPGFIIDHNAAPHYVSLNFNLAGEDLPPADPAAVVTNLPDLACGIVAFDAWVLNTDRHTQNIAYDTTTNRVQIFDHSHAFFVGGGRTRLEASVTQLGLGGHCLAVRLRSLDGLRPWCRRIGSVPDYYISSLVAPACEVGLPSEDRDFCATFLMQRRDRLATLLKDNQATFPQVQPHLWDAFDADGGV